MKLLRYLTFCIVLVGASAFAASAQKNDPKKPPPKPPPPVIKPGEKPPKSENKPKKPAEAMALSTRFDSLFA